MATAEKIIYKNKLYFKCRRQNIDFNIIFINNLNPDLAIRENTK